jgi:hypothetical protein
MMPRLQHTFRIMLLLLLLASAGAAAAQEHSLAGP